MKRLVLKILLPWLVTVVALYFAFRGVDWGLLWDNATKAQPLYVLATILLTVISYILRAARWPLLFPDTPLPLGSSYRVLVLGFFMNNILPARAGELVRAHLGAKVVGKPRTLVLATIASERLADGLTISLMFAGIIMVFGQGHLDPEYATNLMYVAYLFIAVAIGVIASTYTLSRLKIFIHGLSPLCVPSRAFKITLWSLTIWLVELAAFACVAAALQASLSLSGTVMFLVAVNFSSLIPAAPGGFGVIELVAKSVLMSVGVASSEQALCMVLMQHVIQYAVIGIPGAFLLSTLRSQLNDMTEDFQATEPVS